jgi:two-component system invasion response regulator UvrY
MKLALIRPPADRYEGRRAVFHLGRHLEQRPIRVAVADDHTLLRQGLRKLIEEQPDMEMIAETSSGDGILEMLRDSDAKVLLLDLMMPDVDGYDVLRSMQVTGCYVPTLVMVEEEGEVDPRKVLDLGASGVISKRAATAQLLIAIREVYQGMKWVDRGSGDTDEHRSHNGAALAKGQVSSDLTPREEEVVSLVSKGLRYREIAGRLSVSPHTLNNHLRNIFDKLQVRGRVELALYGLKHKI